MFCLRLGLSDFQRSRLVCMLSKHCCSLHSCSHGTLCIKNQLMFSENIKEFLSGICPDCFFFLRTFYSRPPFSLSHSLFPPPFSGAASAVPLFSSQSFGEGRGGKRRGRGERETEERGEKKGRGDRKECKKSGGKKEQPRGEAVPQKCR